MDQLVQCGLLKCNGYLATIYSDPITADLWLYFADHCVLLSEITGYEPVPSEKTVLMQLIEHFKSDGVILTKQYIIVLNENSATYLDYSYNKKHTVLFDFLET